MEKYVTVVSVDDQLLSPIVAPPSAPVVIVASSGTGADRAVELSNMRADEHEEEPHGDEVADDSQFVTVLSINHGGDGGGGRGRQNAPEVVLVYRLPGERLGFGLKFQGGTKSNEKIQRLFIQSCAENSPASRVQASWGHLREGDEILEIDGVSVSRMTRIECVKCLKDSNVAIKLLVRNGEGKVQNFYGEIGNGTSASSAGGDGAGSGGGGDGGGGGDLPERKGAPPPPPPVPPRKLNKRKQPPVEQQNIVLQGDVQGPPAKQNGAVTTPMETHVPPPDPENYSNLFSDDISDLISESDDTASTISTVVDKFSICSSLSSEDYTIPSNGGPAGIGQSAELAKALKPFTLLEQEFNLESKFETTNLFTFKPPPLQPTSLTSNVVQLEVPAAEKPLPPELQPTTTTTTTEYENVTIMKVDENRNYENVTVPYGPYENVTIQTVQPYENMVLSRSALGKSRQSVNQPAAPAALPTTDGGVYENVDLKAPVPPRPLPRQGSAVVVEPKKRAPIPVPIPIVVPPPRMKPAKVQPPSEEALAETPASTPLGSEYNTIQSWLQEATEVIHECALNTSNTAVGGEEISSTEEKAAADAKPSSGDLPRLIDFHRKVSVPLKSLEEVEAVAPPASPVRFDGSTASQATVAFTVESSPERYELPPSESVVRKCIKILSSEDHTYIESSSSDEDEEKLYGRSEDEDDRSSSLSREATTTPEQFLSGDGGYSDEDGEKLGPPEIVSGGPSEAYFNFPWTSNLLPPIGEVEEEFSSLEHQHNGPIVIINTAEETVINDTNNNQQRQERKKPIDDELPPVAKLPHATVQSTKIVITSDPGHRIEPMSEEVPTSVNGSGSGGAVEPDDMNDQLEQISAVDQIPAVEDEDEEDDQDAVDSDDSLEVDNDTDKRAEQAREPQQSKIQPTATVSDEKVNSVPTSSTDKVVTVAEPSSINDGSTCPDHVDHGGVDDSTTALDAEAASPIDECSATMEESDVASVNAMNGTIDPKTDGDVENGAVDDSNIDAICGDVDIVVGDTVESDFEELVKAQVEPLDVDADSSEQQIQQIHERIIVGIERAVSDEGDNGADAEVLEQRAVVETAPERGDDSAAVPVEPAVVEIEAEAVAVAEQEPTENDHPTEQESNHIASAGPTTSAGTTESSSTGQQQLQQEPDAGTTNTTNVHTNADKSAPGSVTSMDSMNNVVTTTTTVTAIASTVHQLIPAPSPAAATNGGKVAPPAFSRLPPDGHEFPPNFTEPTTTTTNGGGSVPSSGAMTITNGGGTAPVPFAKPNDKHSSFNDDLPDLPKSHPPPVPRKIPTTPTGADSFRKPPPFPATRSSSIAESMLSRKELPQAYQTLQSLFEQRRRSVDVPDHHGKVAGPPTTNRISLSGSNWRKDEKSEKSVRDKIAMFSSAADAEGGAVAPVPQPLTAVAAVSSSARKFSKDFTKSSENLLLGSRDSPARKTSIDPIETYATLRKKAHSVEHLDEVDRGVKVQATTVATASTIEAPYKAKFSLETSKPVVLGKAYSVENLNPTSRSMESGAAHAGNGVSDGSKILSRTTSFSGYSNGNSLATIASPNTPSGTPGTDERWKSSISNLLEQRKKSMSKLRGLVIPEKVPEAEVLTDSRLIGLPIIKSKDSEIILSSSGISKPELPDLSYGRKTSTLPMPPKPSLNSMTRSTPSTMVIKAAARLQTPASESESEQSVESGTFRKPLLPPMPPAKPPRTSLVYQPPSKSGSSDCLRSTEDESDDSDSVLSSRVSSPPVSPVAPVAPTVVEKYALTRTLSSETNTSVTSSASTLTSSSGSQASCSSVGSTPTVDISRKLSKSSSSEASMNRKNVLASAKSRNGRGDLKIEEVGTKTGHRYEDGDSTDGYEEEERRKSKSKPRNSLTNGGGASANGKAEITHYKVVDRVDSIVDKVIKVASYVEVVSDLEDNSAVEDTIVPSTVMPPPPPPVAEKPTPEQPKRVSHDATNAASMSDLAKWVRHEAARTISSSNKEPESVAANKESRKISPPAPVTPAPAPVPVRRELRSSVETKKLNLAEIRKSFESKSANSTVIPAPVKPQPKDHSASAVAPQLPPSTPSAPVVIPTVAAAPAPSVPTPPKTHHANNSNGHDRFSSWDSLASSSSGVSSLQTNSLGLGNGVAPPSRTLQSTPSDYGSFSSLGSSHSLITPQDLQLIIEEADPPLATPDAFVVVLQRETPESSIGITLAGGSDYEAKEITIHKILTNSPADRDGRLKKGDRLLSINGLSMRGLTHRESLSVLKTPRPEVVMVITRSKSLVIDTTLTKLKRPSMGSLSSLAEKSEITTEYERKLKIQHKASRSLDLDHLDVGSNEAESVFDGTASEDGLLSADDISKCSSSNANDNASFSAVQDVPEGCRMVEINKDGAGLGFSIEGGYDSPTGNKPLIIKKIFMGGAAEKSGILRAGEEIVAINEVSIAKMTRIQVWNMMKKLPNGSVRITLK